MALELADLYDLPNMSLHILSLVHMTIFSLKNQVQ